DDLARQAKDIVQIQKQTDDLKNAIALLKQQIPGEAQIPVLLFDLERMVKDSDGTLNSFEPGKLRAFSGGGGTATQDIQELPVTIRASATYPEVIKFLDALNAYERKLNVSDLTLSPAGSAGVAKSDSGNSAPVFQNTLNVQFTLLAYVLKEGGTSP
ncbi:MAG TPA: type 4a pilus biogenesis protein PilO, partial [Oscillatoriaceae cyanobacterium]